MLKPITLPCAATLFNPRAVAGCLFNPQAVAGGWLAVVKTDFFNHFVSFSPLCTSLSHYPVCYPLIHRHILTTFPNSLPISSSQVNHEPEYQQEQALWEHISTTAQHYT